MRALTITTQTSRLSSSLFQSIRQYNNLSQTKPSGLARKFSNPISQVPKPTQITQRTFITDQMIIGATIGLIGIGAVSGGIITIISRWLFGRYKDQTKYNKEYENFMKGKQLQNKTTEQEFEQFKKNYDDFQKFLQEKKNKDKDI